MTGGRIKQAATHFRDDETFMITYGDGVSDVNIRALVDFHRSHGRLATVTAVQPFARFGIVEVGSDSRVLDFAEKPQVKGWANAGFMVCNRRTLEYIDDDPACVLEKEPLQRLACDSELVAYRHNGFFFAMDTYREYLYLNELWNSGRAPWAIWCKDEDKHEAKD
jgi:glucose-1-phosphate cytidylyltransferase